MQVLFPCCAGLDVHKKTVVVCVMLTAPDGSVRKETRTFATLTRDLLLLRDWLVQLGCTIAAMESTGSYWKPVFNILEGSLAVWVVNAQHYKGVPGHKTDVRDAEWLADLLRHGLLKPSFIPPQPQRDLRELTRGRATLVGDRARLLNRIQQVLESANLKLTSVASDVTGVSCRRILAEIVQGELSPAAMAELSRGRLRLKRETLAAALEGRVREHHRFLLAQLMEQGSFLEEQIATYDRQIELHVEAMSVANASEDSGSRGSGEDPPAGPPSSPAEAAPPPGSPAPGETPLTFQQAVVLLDALPGMGQRSAQNVLAEIGVDMGRFRQAGNLTSWAGLAPGNHESAGKRRSQRVLPGSGALRKAMLQVAHGAVHTRNSYFQALYHRIAARRGKKRAMVAVARSLLVVIYHLLLRREPYRELGSAYHEERNKEALTRSLTTRLEKLGHKVVLEPVAA